jgi:hypothetical protein
VSLSHCLLVLSHIWIPRLTKSLKMSGFRVAVRENVRVRGAGGAKQALREDDDSSTDSD